MSTRALALALAAAGGVGLLLADPTPAVVPGLFGALLGVAAVALATGRVRRLLALGAALLWAATAGLAVPDGPLLVATALAGLAGALLILLKGRDWPGWSSRYQRLEPGSEHDATPRQMWDSLDRGWDPTRPGDTGPD